MISEQLLYQFAVPHREGSWLIVPARLKDGRYTFYAFAPEGDACGGSDHRWTYPTPEAAIKVGRCYVDLLVTSLAEEEAA